MRINSKTSIICNTAMEKDIQNYSNTVMFRGTPCIWYNTMYVLIRYNEYCLIYVGWYVIFPAK